MPILLAMRDLHVNITGPRDRARQNVSLQIAQDDHRRSLDVEQISSLIAQLRVGLEQSQLPPEDLRRAERRLATIEEEARSEKPLLSEITEGMSFLSGLVQSAQGLSPLLASTMQLLAAAVGS